jgi:diguanylate cyclase (GGDEF)-like protein
VSGLRLLRRTEQFGTRITRRMVLLFMVCALLPVGAALLLAYDGVQQALRAERTNQLRATAAQYGVSLIERLTFAESMGRVALAQVAARRGPGGEAFDNYFRAAMTLDEAGARAMFGALTPQAGLTSRDRNLHIVRGPGQTLALWLSVRAGAGQVIALELDPAFLWGSAEELPYLTDICVLGPARLTLYCSRPMAMAGLGAVPVKQLSQARGQVGWEESGTRFLAGYSEVFLRARYGADSWTVVAAQPEAHALAAIQAVERIVLPTVVLGLLLAALMGLVQVRRTLGPLKELADATARVAVQDFSVRVGVERDDEFGALAGAFNAMSARLGRQFTALAANAEVDAMILAGVSLPRLAEIVLRRLSELAQASQHLLLLAEPGLPGHFRLFSSGYTQDRDGLPVVLSWDDAGVLRARDRGWRFAAGDASRPAWLRHLSGACFVLPISLGTDLAGAMVLGYDQQARADEELSILSKLGDRIAVALAAVNRDLELHRRAHYDALTQLPNRLLAMEEIGRAIAAAARHQRSLALLFVDLDGFSDVNDSFGHESGDRLLAQSAERLRRCVRKSDLVARLGGDEFVIVLTELAQSADAAVAARHTIEALSRPYVLGGASAFVSASVGIALYPGDGQNAEDLLRHADLAMYSAKEEGRGQASFFTPSMNEEVRQRVEAERELRQALDAGEFELYYQPQQALPGGRIIGAEALLRWNHPRHGLMLPGRFIAHAESSGLIEAIGHWVLKAGCAQFVAWRAAGLALQGLSINISPRQFRRLDLALAVTEVLQAQEMPASALHLEITESALLNDDPAANANLARLHQLGVRLEIDDFGTGYSSLARLQRLPVAGVKLDQSFVAPIEESEGARAVVRAAIDMAHALGKYVVAEGVEKEGQRTLLAGMGCDFLQGHYLSEALPAARFAELFAAQPA